jgi:hypothetical protein
VGVCAVVIVVVVVVVVVMVIMVTGRHVHFVSIVVGATLRRNLACQRIQGMQHFHMSCLQKSLLKPAIMYFCYTQMYFTMLSCFDY